MGNNSKTCAQKQSSAEDKLSKMVIMNLLKTCVSIVFHKFRQAKKKKKRTVVK